MEIEFDHDKAVGNERKHGIAFEEAITALLDETALCTEDDSEGEPRWITLGRSARGRLLTVVYTLRGDTIRLISARKATRKEIRTYES